MPIDYVKLKRRVKLRDLDTLMTVVSVGSMHKAAALLHLSEPAISKAVAELEDVLGVTLLERSRQGVAITLFGQTIVKRATAMFDELQQGAHELEHHADPHSGHIDLACTETLNAGLISVAMERMARQYSRVTFSVDSGDTPLLLSHYLLKRNSDFVLARTYGAVIDPEIHTEPLFHERMQVVVSQSSRWAMRRKLRLQELVDEPWILSRSEATGDSPVVAAFRAAGLSLPTCTVLTGSLNLRYSLLATGRFVTVMPHSFLRFGAARSPLKVLPVNIPSWHIPTSILTLAKRPLSPTAAKFLDIVRELTRPLNT